MNVYLLVEGKRTERKVYPAWLAHLVPELARVDRFDDVVRNGYFIFSAEGYPSILHQHLPNAVRDVNQVGRYDYLVVFLDPDECSCMEREQEVRDVLRNQGLTLERAELKIIVQNRCIETWFLGNRRIVSRNPQNPALREYIEFYDVRQNDPEEMGRHPDFTQHSPFHAAYLREVLREKQLSYTKTRPGHVCDASYLQELVARTQELPSDLGTFRGFVAFCAALRSKIRAAA